MQACNFLARTGAQGRIQVGEGLIEHEDLRMLDDGAADGDALALAAGELRGQPFQQRFQFQHPGNFREPPRDLGARDPRVEESKRNVLANRHVRVERIALKDHRYAALSGWQVLHSPSVDLDRSGVDGLEPRDHAQQRGLAAARRTQNHQELVRGDLQGEIIEHPGAAEALADTSERHTAH